MSTNTRAFFDRSELFPKLFMGQDTGSLQNRGCWKAALTKLALGPRPARQRVGFVHESVRLAMSVVHLSG
jgi:hypothetical protein